MWLARMSPERKQKLNVVGDCVILVLASLLSTMTDASPGVNAMVGLAMAFGGMLVWVAGGRVLRHYDAWNGRRALGDFAMTVVLLVGTCVPLFLLRKLVPIYAERSDFARFLGVLVPGVLSLRLLTSWMQRRAEEQPPPVLILGVGPLGRHTGLEIRDSRPFEVLGYLHFGDEEKHTRLPAPILGAVSQLDAMLKQHVVGEVYVAGNYGSHHAEMQQAIRTCERFGVPFALPAGGFRFGRAKPANVKSMDDGYVHYLCVLHKPVQLALKRALDIMASGTALALLSPLLVGVAVAIKLTSRGPILFRQERVGMYGRRFHMLKFRSMVVNAEELKAKLAAQNEQQGPVFKMKRDPRVTAVGRFIRKFSIDELPQLINVLRGEMAVVGPRPPIPREVEQYEAWQRRRLSVRPGLTCVWQVSGRNEISFEDWMYLDMQYIDHWSLAQDFSLILKTVPIVLTGKGAS